MLTFLYAYISSQSLPGNQSKLLLNARATIHVLNMVLLEMNCALFYASGVLIVSKRDNKGVEFKTPTLSSVPY